MALIQKVHLRRAVVQATQAPSIASTQPWHFELFDDYVDVLADRSQQLGALDPHGRQLIMSVGSALFNARASLAQSGCSVAITELPDPSRSDLLARVGRPFANETVIVEPIGYLAEQIEQRRSVGEQYNGKVVPQHLRPVLQSAAEHEGAELRWLETAEQIAALAEVTERAELTQKREHQPLADFRSQVSLRPHFENVASAPVGAALVLSTRDDEPGSWLRAGQALQRVLLELSVEQCAALPLTGVIEVPWARAELRALLGTASQPHVVLLIGAAVDGVRPRRRLLVDVLTEH